MVTGLNLTLSYAPAMSDSLAAVVLQNPGNHCYLDSVVYLLAYACSVHAPHGPPRGATALEHALSSTISGPGMSTPRGEQMIANMPAWRSLLGEWQHMHRQ